MCNSSSLVTSTHSRSKKQRILKQGMYGMTSWTRHHTGCGRNMTEQHTWDRQRVSAGTRVSAGMLRAANSAMLWAEVRKCVIVPDTKCITCGKKSDRCPSNAAGLRRRAPPNASNPACTPANDIQTIYQLRHPGNYSCLSHKITLLKLLFRHAQGAGTKSQPRAFVHHSEWNEKINE